MSNDGSNWGSPVATGAGSSAVTTITFAPRTAPGNPNILAISGTDFSASESAANVKDGNLGTKYYNAAQDGFTPRGINTGFVITPQIGNTVINGLQIATANDVPDRDPIAITIEGSNASDAGQAGGDGFNLIWQGPTSLAQDPGRYTWGQRYSFFNTVGYRSYRVLVTALRGSGGGAQYSEVRLFGQTLPKQTALEIAPLPGCQIQLMWLNTATTLRLHSTSNLTPPVTWLAVTNPPVLSNNQWILALPMGGDSQRFYRLGQ